MPSSLDRLNKIGFSAPKKFSKFDLSFTNSISQNGGEIMPIFSKEVMAGDTFTIESNHVTRMITPAVPIMDNLLMDQYFFFVPMRLCSRDPKDWEAIYGTDKGLITYNEQTAYSTGNALKAHHEDGDGDIYYDIDSTTWTNVPSLKYGALAALGYPVLQRSSNNSDKVINLFKANAYIRIFNDWFRDENLQPEIPLANTSVNNYNNAAFTFWKCLNPGGTSDPVACLYANRLHDYFTSCLPAPQSGNAVTMPLAGTAPVVPIGTDTNTGSVVLRVSGALAGGGSSFDSWVANNDGNLEIPVSPGAELPSINGTNLYADLAEATGATITALRQAFAIQAILERDMLGGHKRYNELLQAHFNTSPSDSTLQRSQYLASMRSMLSVSQVIQSTPTESSPLGSTGAFSNTTNSKYLGSFSFNEPGYIIGVSIIRPLNTFAYSVDKTIYRNRRFDYYWPLLANISEMPVDINELLPLKATSTLGYQEAWQDYRTSRNEIHGAFVYDSLIKQWTFADFKDNYTGLNQVISYRDTISQTLVSNSAPYQFISNFYFKVIATRPMPMFSIPARLGGYF